MLLNPALAPSVERSDAEDGAERFRVSKETNTDAARQFLRRHGDGRLPHIVPSRVELVELDGPCGASRGAIVVRPVADAEAARAAASAGVVAGEPIRFFLDIERQLELPTRLRVRQRQADFDRRELQALLDLTVNVFIDDGERVSHATIPEAESGHGLGAPDALFMRAQSGDVVAQRALAEHRAHIERFASQRGFARVEPLDRRSRLDRHEDQGDGADDRDARGAPRASLCAVFRAVVAQVCGLFARAG